MATVGNPITIGSSTVTSVFSPSFLEYAMIAGFAIALVFIGIKMFKKPNYRYWLRLIDGNEERDIPLTRIDEVNFVSVKGNIRVYKDPTVKMVKNGKRYVLYGWGIQPYYIAKDPQTLTNIGIRDLLIRTDNKEVRFDGTWKSIIDYYTYMIKNRIDVSRELTLDDNTQLVIAVDYPSIIKSLIEDLLHTNVKHSLRQLEEVINIEKNVTANKVNDFGWLKWVIVGMMVIGVFIIVLSVLHR